MKKVVFFTGSYGRSSAVFLAKILEKFGYETVVTDEEQNILRGAELVVIDECSTDREGQELIQFLKAHPVIPYILCGCDGCKEKEFLWGKQNREILKRIFGHLGEESMSALLS